METQQELMCMHVCMENGFTKHGENPVHVIFVSSFSLSNFCIIFFISDTIVSSLLDNQFIFPGENLFL